MPVSTTIPLPPKSRKYLVPIRAYVGRHGRRAASQLFLVLLRATYVTGKAEDMIVNYKAALNTTDAP